MRTPTPNFVSQSASTSPVGPAPTIRTSQRFKPVLPCHSPDQLTLTADRARPHPSHGRRVRHKCSSIIDLSMISARHIRLAELERELLQQRIEPGNFHWLEEIVREAGLPSRISIARATPPAYGNEYGAMPRGLQNPGDLEPIEAGHADVEQRQMRGHLLDELEGVRPIVGHVDLM